VAIEKAKVDGRTARVVLEVEVDDARRDAGALRHFLGRRLERAFVDQVEQGVDGGCAGALGARGASVYLGLLDRHRAMLKMLQLACNNFFALA